MLRSVAHQIRPTRSAPDRLPEVCVVDPQAGDYQAWQAMADSGQVRLRIVATAEAALRLAQAKSAQSRSVDLWVVNAALPGLSGIELCSMLRSRNGQAPVYVVADEYSPITEQAAWAARATLFGCKGAHQSWLNDWLATVDSSATQRRPSYC